MSNSWLDHLNEWQLDSLQELAKAVRGMHNADIQVRKDGQDIWFQADWLKWLLPEIIKALGTNGKEGDK